MPQVSASERANLLRVAQRDLRRVERAARDLDKARDELRRSILLAREAGETFEDIGRAAGLSRQRVQQIVRGE
jgi:DNA-directed RNA polymerase sigma subunit (sigma70/sigma32)